MNRLYLTLHVESLYHGTVRLVARCEGRQRQVLKLLAPKELRKTSDGEQALEPRIAMVHESSNASVGTGGEIFLAPGSDGLATASASIIDATDDSGWWSYPLMHGRCEVAIQVKGHAPCVVQCVFPKSIHPLPTESYLECNDRPVRCSDQYMNYPDVQLAFIYEVPTALTRDLRFVAKYREAEQVVAVPVGLPFVINVGVFGIGAVMGLAAERTLGPLQATLQVTRSAMVVAILPLYWALWNSSNVLRSIPTTVNLITTSMAITVVFNVAVAMAWIAEIPGGMRATALSVWLIGTYTVLASWIVWTIVTFVIRHRDEELMMVKLQRTLYRGYGIVAGPYTGVWRIARRLLAGMVARTPKRRS